MRRREPRHTDDAGADITQLKRSHIASIEDEVLGKHLSYCMAAAGKAGPDSSQTALVVVGIGLVLVTIIVLALISPGLGVYLYNAAIFAFVVTLCVSVVVEKLKQTAIDRPGGFARAVANRGFCGACAYDLRYAADSNSTETVACPECGARWARARIATQLTPSSRIDPLATKRGRSRLFGNDDRGSLTRIIRASTRNLRSYKRRWHPDQFSTLRTTRKRIARPSQAIVAIALALLPIGAAAYTLQNYNNTGIWEPDQIRAVIVVPPLCLLLVWIARMSDLGVHLAPWTTAVRDAGICPACGDQLSRGRVDAQGFTVCATCGSSWKPANQTGDNIAES